MFVQLFTKRNIYGYCHRNSKNGAHKISAAKNRKYPPKPGPETILPKNVAQPCQNSIGGAKIMGYAEVSVKKMEFNMKGTKMTTNDTKLIIPALSGIYSSLDKYADLILRVTAGGLLIPHGMQKLFGAFGGKIEGTAGFFSKFGLEPALPFAYYIGMLEFFGGILLVIGLFTRLVSVQLLVFMLVAAFYVHINIGGFFWTKLGFEYPLMWAVVALYFVIKGGGKYSIDHKRGKEF